MHACAWVDAFFPLEINVFDTAYAEHLARDNSFEAGASTRVNEPGRFVWAKLNYRFE